MFFIQAALGIFWLLGEAGSLMNLSMSRIWIGTRTILEATRVLESQAKLNVTWRKRVSCPMNSGTERCRM